MMAQDIIDSIDQIYKKFYVMPNLQTHMKRVAKVGLLIASNWNTSVNIDSEYIEAALLLHDLGNIVKFTQGDRDLHWQKVKQQIIQKYESTSDHEVTQKMLIELNVPDRVLTLIQIMKFENLPNILLTSDYGLKICAYSDLRVAPVGVVSIEERFEDLRKRYQGIPLVNRYSNMAQESAHLLEGQIFNHVSISPNEIATKIV